MIEMARTRRSATASPEQAELKCPECGKTFTRAASLGAHRSAAHGVAGSSRQAKRSIAKRRTRTTEATAGKRTRRSASQASGARSATVQRRRTQTTNGHNGHGRINRDALLRTVFPKGIPASDEAITRAKAWLDEAEKIARTR